MSNELTKSHLGSVFERSDEKMNKENAEQGDGAPPSNTSTDGSLFQMLSPELLLFVFEWIGYDDISAYIHLAADCGLEQFIYKDCKHLWKEIDLSKLRGTVDTDDQLQALLE